MAFGTNDSSKEIDFLITVKKKRKEKLIEKGG
jgi:hypothetical protein